jgi:hypothetical protein
MPIDARKRERLADIANEIFECMAQAYHERDYEVADRLFKVWIKLPSPLPYHTGPMGGGSYGF